MKKVVAFLEQYAEWLALGVACLFLLYMVYANVISPDHVQVSVGNEKVMPGDVDKKIAENSVTRLQTAMDAPAGITFPVKDFAKEFATAMGSGRDRMTQEFLAGGNPRPGIPTEMPQNEKGVVDGPPITELAVVPAPVAKASSAGNSLVDPPPPPADPNNPAAVAPPPPAGAVVDLTNALDKNWVTVEFREDLKALSDAWAKAFFDPKTKKLMAGVPAQVLMTQFLMCEVEREEQIAPGQWGNAVKLKPLPLVQMMAYPGDAASPKQTPEEFRQSAEEYRIWSEKNQYAIAEPGFFRVLHGDPWYVPSDPPKDDPAAVAAVGAKEPFDPANPPKRELTSAEKGLVYNYNLGLKAEKQKAEAAARKSKLDAAKTSTGGGAGGGTGDGGRKRIGGGGYAPLPIQLAAGPALDDGGRPIRSRRGDDTAGGVRRDDGGRIIGGGGRRDNAAGAARENRGGATYDPTLQQNPLLNGPFDPTVAILDVKPVAPPVAGQKPVDDGREIKLWAHDDTVVPGKTYRYKMRVMLKNPLYATFGLAKDEKLSEQFALTSAWSQPLVVSVPPTNVYFFTNYKAQFGKSLVPTIVVDVFKHERGDWMRETFTVAPGDGIGNVKRDVVVGAAKKDIDFTTGYTLVDLRPDTREKDVRIMVADQAGNLNLISLLEQKDDPWYVDLKAKAEATKAAAAAAAAAAAGDATPTATGVVRR